MGRSPFSNFTFTGFASNTCKFLKTLWTVLILIPAFLQIAQISRYLFPSAKFSIILSSISSPILLFLGNCNISSTKQIRIHFCNSSSKYS
nr:hypothetical protein [Spiroplasma ixodetis]